MPRATNFGSLNVGSRRSLPGSDIKCIKRGTFTLDPASIASAGQAVQTVTIAGLTTSDFVILNPPAALEALIVGQARVSAANTLVFTLANLSGAAVDAASGVWQYVAIRF